jgi:Ni/Co efflux regulator RcnB
MKRSAVAIFALVLCAVGTGSAFAQPRPEHPEWRQGYRMEHGDWDRGRRIDFREHHLREPPRGYEWREVDGRFVLAAIATGVIADIVLGTP